MRKFYKVSFEELSKHLKITKEEYEKYPLPKRGTRNSAGYDFHFLKGITINPGETKKIPTGIKAQMNPGEVLLIFIRSSLGTKHHIVLSNQTGIIDSDYFENEDNEGHIFIVIQNTGTTPQTFKKYDRFAQGIFINYLKTDDDDIKETRKGGFGSTTRKEWLICHT